MTQEQKQIKIAEACGWTEIEPCTCHNGQARGFQPVKGAHKKHTPDYFSDLNAMHEAEKLLAGEQWVKYVRFLGEATQEQKGRCHATAAQRAEAFGLTLGLWK
jgi:hypothetical protein